MKRAAIATAAGLLLFGAGCEEPAGLWRLQRLPSGRLLEVSSAQLVWGDDHGERLASEDCFQLSYVTSEPAASQAARDREAVEAFELIRPLSELWGFDRATLLSYPARRSPRIFDLYAFRRAGNGGWEWTRTRVEPPK